MWCAAAEPRQLLHTLSWLQVESLLISVCGLLLRYSLLPCCAFPSNNKVVILCEESLKIITMPWTSHSTPPPKVKTYIS